MQSIITCLLLVKAATAHGSSPKVYTHGLKPVTKLEAMLTMAQDPSTQVYECYPVHLDKDKLAIKRVKQAKK